MNDEFEEVLKPVREDPSYLNLWSAYKKILSMELSSIDEKDTLHLSLIGSSTLEPLAACIDIKTRLEGFSPSTFVGGFNTYRQEAMDKNSPLYKSKPDVIILAVDAWSILDQNFLSTYPGISDKERNDLRKQLVKDVGSIAQILETNTSAVILVNNFIVPVFSPLGIVDNKQKIGLKRFFKDANLELFEMFSESSRVFVVDLDSAAADFGKSRITNWNTWYRGSVPFSEEFSPTLADTYLRYIRAFKAKTK
ncbi:MAG: hypothetical protein ACFFEL_05030, partial [Candidatus Thorarchaeota archaeon]